MVALVGAVGLVAPLALLGFATSASADVLDPGTDHTVELLAVPVAPTGVVATPGNAQATVTFVPAVNQNQNAVLSYTVTSSPEGKTGTGNGSPIPVTGLTNGVSYTFTVTVTETQGGAVKTSLPSEPSNSVTARTVPGVPTAVVATAGNGQASVAFTVPASNGGSAITGYTVTSTPGGKMTTGTGSPLVVTGLDNGTKYTFTVTATNAAGMGALSVVSNEVTPAALVTPPAATKKELAVTGVSDLALPLGLAGVLLTAGMAMFGAARLRGRSGMLHIG